MKRLLLIIFMLLYAAFARAQGGNALVLTGAGAPAGACSYIMFWVQTSGAFWDCAAGTWNSVSGGGGGALPTTWSTNGSTNITAGATSIFDLSGITTGQFKTIITAGGVSTATQQFVFDSTAGLMHAWNGADSILPQTKGTTSHQWLSSYSMTTGLFVQSQPAIGDLSGYTAGDLMGDNGSAWGKVTVGSGLSLSAGALSCSGCIGYPSGSGFAIVSASNAWGSTLADPLVVGHGGTGTASTLTGIVRGGSPLTASELSGDATTSGSNAVTVVKINGTSLAGLATGILKNTTATGVPSIAAAGTDYQAPLTGTGLARNSGAATELSGVVTTSGSNVTSYAIANTTFTVSNATFSANTCTKLDSTAGSSTVTMTGMATSSVISIAPAADTATIVGFGTTGGLVIDAWPTSNTANIKVCNQTASGITTGATLVFNISAR